jgi:Sec-independent protein translocase protein TatA
MEIDEDLNNLTDLLEKLPNLILALNGTVSEMKNGSNTDEDFEEKKEQIDEWLEELDDISTCVEKYIEDLVNSKESNESIKKQSKKSQSLENLQKVAN